MPAETEQEEEARLTWCQKDEMNDYICICLLF